MVPSTVNCPDCGVRPHRHVPGTLRALAAPRSGPCWHCQREDHARCVWRASCGCYTCLRSEEVGPDGLAHFTTRCPRCGGPNTHAVEPAYVPLVLAAGVCEACYAAQEALR